MRSTPTNTEHNVNTGYTAVDIVDAGRRHVAVLER